MRIHYKSCSLFIIDVLFVCTQRVVACKKFTLPLFLLTFMSFHMNEEYQCEGTHTPLVFFHLITSSDIISPSHSMHVYTLLHCVFCMEWVS